MSNEIADSERHQKEVLMTKVFIKAGEQLGLTDEQMSGSIGLDTIEYQKLAMGQRTLNFNEPEFEQAVWFVNLYKHVMAAVGNDEAYAKHWMHSGNLSFGGQSPAEVVCTPQGVDDLIGYFDRYVSINHNRDLDTLTM